MATLSAGASFGPFRLIEPLGRGGMASVWKAHEAALDRFVALKVLPPEFLHEETFAARFQREARVIARLEHPHLLPVYDFDGEHDPPYIVMRYLDGGTLKQVKQQGAVPRDEFLYILRQLAGALDYAHRQNIVHRDLKPSNVMIDKEGNAFLTDFGIARAAGGDKDLTGTGLMIGTPGYMAPEQARGDGQADKAADIYSLGVIAFEMLTGTPPYDHESSIEIILAHMNSPVPKASERTPDLPKGVDAVLAQALAKDPQKRFATATEFVDALTRSLKIKPSEARAALQSMTHTISVDQLAAFRAQQGESDTPSSATPSDQQRQMTAVSVDVKELAEILYEGGSDTERAKATLDSLWAAFADLAKASGGVLQSRVEAAGLFLWGRDRPREDDAENAIRAALAMQDRTLVETRKVLGTSWEPTEENPLPFAAGITTGPVLLERDTQSGAYNASGAPITLAGRLKDSAPPGGVIVAHETFTLVRGVFTVYQREPLRVRGRKEPIETYLVTAVRPRAFRLRAMGIEGVETKMIGREIELRLLQEALTLTLEDGETQVVTVVGEAGVGKSRLLFEFSNWTDIMEQTVLFFQARATQPSMLQPYSLTRDLFSFRFQILDSDPLSVVHEKFVKGVERFMGAGSERKAYLIGQLVGFDFSSKPEVEAALADGDTFRRMAQDYLGEFFTSASRVDPVMLHIEDIHWADDRSLDLINNLVRDNTNLPLFVLCMARPSLYERRPQWGEGQRFHERIQLEPLSQLSSRRLVRELLKNVPEIPTALRDLVVDRADGNPFYIEELIKALIDDRVILKGDPDWSVDTTRLSTVRVPATLTGVLQARLDTLPQPLQHLLQRASVVGRIFWDAAAIHLSRESGELTADEVQDMLENLRDREMILQREESGFAGTVEYVFRHAILRDVTYDTIIPRQRRALHKLVADWLIEIGGERAGEHTLLVAEHYARAEEASLAAAQLARAGERALQLSAMDEAGTLIQRAREMLTGPEHTEQRIRVDLLRAELEGVRTTYDKAMEILKPALEDARSIGSAILQAQILGQLGRLFMWRADAANSKKYLEEALDMARTAGDATTLIFNLRQLGNALTLHSPAEGLPYLKESVELARKQGDRYAEGHGLNSVAISYSLQGDMAQAEATYLRGLELNRILKNRVSESMVLGNLSGLHSALGQLDRAESEARESMAIAKELGSPPLRMNAEIALADVSLRTRRNADARSWIRAAANSMREIGTRPTVIPMLYGVLRIRGGDRANGLRWIGFTRANDPNKKENEIFLKGFMDEVRGDWTEEQAETAMREGETLKLEEILAEEEKEI
jgi:serine/threonine protein kinase/tetratricopeptide (TPR) repeat protein